MRNLLLLLVLANLGFLAWASWFDRAPDPGPPYAGPGIVLLRELGPDAMAQRTAVSATRDGSAPDAGAVDADAGGAAVAARDTDASAGASPGEPPGSAQIALAAPSQAPAGRDRCIAIGPFAARGDADSAFETLIAAGFTPERATEQREVMDGYWVYIEDIDSMARAREIDADLATNGLEDAYAISGSEGGILISLGVFSNITRAGTQAERVGRLGYEATIAESTRTEETHWLDLRLGPAESGALDLLQEPGRISRFVERDCETLE